MSIKFSVHPTPKPKERTGKTIYHARLVTQGTKRMDDICKHINETSSLSSADIKGTLEALCKYIGFQLQYGYSVELEGLGHFSVSLQSKQTVNTKGKAATRVTIDGVNFRCSPKLKQRIKETTLKKVKETVDPFPDIEDRQKRMIDFMEQNGSINLHQYAELNACTLYRANKDIKGFLEKGLITPSGMGTHRIYLLPA